ETVCAAGGNTAIGGVCECERNQRDFRPIKVRLVLRPQARRKEEANAEQDQRLPAKGTEHGENPLVPQRENHGTNAQAKNGQRWNHGTPQKEDQNQCAHQYSREEREIFHNLFFLIWFCSASPAPKGRESEWQFRIGDSRSVS